MFLQIITAWAGLAFVSRAVREERGQTYSAPEVLETTNRYNERASVCTSWRSASSSALVAQSFFTSTRFVTLMPRSTRRRHHMHQHLQPLSSSPFAPVDLQAFPPVASVPPPLVPPVNHSAPPPSPGAGIIPLVTDCLTQLSGGLLNTSATLSSPAAVPTLHRLVSARGLGWAAGQRAVIEHTRRRRPGLGWPPGGARSPSSRSFIAAIPASAGPL